MPGREITLSTEQFYHVLNRGVASQPTFTSGKEYIRAVDSIRYYQNQEPPQKYSWFIDLSQERRREILNNLAQSKQFLVEIVAYCLMPNHFHLLLKQQVENGISKFMSNFTNSYTRYFNTKNKRVGPLFQGKFKAKRVETDEQLIHLSRYIHLNPFSSSVVKTIEQLKKYQFSSLPEYLGKAPVNFCNKEVILGQFKNSKQYQKFIFDQATYQRELEKIKHLVLED